MCSVTYPTIVPGTDPPVNAEIKPNHLSSANERCRDERGLESPSLQSTSGEGSSEVGWLNVKSPSNRRRPSSYNGSSSSSSRRTSMEIGGGGGRFLPSTLFGGLGSSFRSLVTAIGLLSPVGPRPLQNGCSDPQDSLERALSGRQVGAANTVSATESPTAGAPRSILRRISYDTLLPGEVAQASPMAATPAAMNLPWPVCIHIPGQDTSSGSSTMTPLTAPASLGKCKEDTKTICNCAARSLQCPTSFNLTPAAMHLQHNAVSYLGQQGPTEAAFADVNPRQESRTDEAGSGEDSGNGASQDSKQQSSEEYHSAVSLSQELTDAATEILSSSAAGSAISLTASHANSRGQDNLIDFTGTSLATHRIQRNRGATEFECDKTKLVAGESGEPCQSSALAKSPGESIAIELPSAAMRKITHLQPLPQGKVAVGSAVNSGSAEARLSSSSSSSKRAGDCGHAAPGAAGVRRSLPPPPLSRTFLLL